MNSPVGPGHRLDETRKSILVCRVVEDRKLETVHTISDENLIDRFTGAIEKGTKEPARLVPFGEPTVVVLNRGDGFPGKPEQAWYFYSFTIPHGGIPISIERKRGKWVAGDFPDSWQPTHVYVSEAWQILSDWISKADSNSA